ncbi:CDP-alcohol phosphatidyltransferase domain protein [Metarhizium robertsii]|uniref:CDP-alcohol phosphatidyltransferase domain protein n=1 Tax=Metarhizium robertsii TaxID=568076 RepID=A0A014NDW8_9HYPO|nr:CDP-alcohol phosphatidyltransferase domain protein [Metarhizium robertsii]
MLMVPFLSRATSRARCRGPSRNAFRAISTRSPAILPRSSPVSPVLRTRIIVRPTESQNQVRYYSCRSSQPQKADHPKAESTSQEKAGNPAVHTPSGTSDVIHEDIYTVPNFLTITRLIAAPVIGYLVLHDSHAWAVGLFAYAGITDLLDGWIARKWNRKTVVGTIIDPMADKALMTILTICLAAKGALPLWVATVILGRDVGLGMAAIYYRWISLPPPKTFYRYWDFSLPSAEVRPTTISKYNTFLQLALVGLTTAAPLVETDLTSVLTTLQYVVAATTIGSGASYIFSKDAVKILK